MNRFRLMLSVAFILLIALIGSLATADDQPAKPKVPAGAKVYVASIGDGFDTYLKSALTNKKVPVQVVDARDGADYEITGVAESTKASTAKKVIFGDWRSREEASIRLTDLKSSEVVWSYSYNNTSSNHGKKSAAESCAKHLKEAIETK